MKENRQGCLSRLIRAGIGYETYDDIALKKSDTETNKQEDKLNTYNGLLNSSSGNEVTHRREQISYNTPNCN